jgi:NADH-quinone oxidoreductase subunit J
MEILLKNIETIAICIFAALTVSGALYVLFAKQIFYAAIGFLISLLGVAALMVFTDSEFVVASQIVIYVGGILVLLLFGIVLGNNPKAKDGSLEIENREFWMSACIVLVVSFLLVFLLSQIKMKEQTVQLAPTVKQLGLSLVSSYSIALELLGFLLLLALVAATFIAKKDD